ncbi:DUF1027 domain-containing protein [Brevibacillus composti]|uniref:DUF1027 domain-containing protein n=1 Tax=Brevibacillus composti TaxID=2796470 RepID=A0A7T5EME6_9BACL|nr:DUF1027 domain-containing protein [Brevibacillus composti]QUO42302.1 DUF1027 domain-containing protein [Brevibacillus composti]
MIILCISKEEAALIRTQAGTYEVMEDNRDGWNSEAFKERYSDILDKYDYIVGDWGYGQLRLRGFYESTNRKVPFEQRIAALDEYLQEYCNFGCPYFVLRKVKANPHHQDPYATDGDERYGDGEANGAEEEIFVERKERKRVHPRQNRQDRSERNQNAGTGERKERGDRPKFRSDKNGRDNGKERRPNQGRPARERDKVPTGQGQPKKE